MPTKRYVAWTDQLTGDKANADLETRLSRRAVCVMDAPYRAVGDGVADDSVAIQAAINTGLNVLFPPGNYKAHGLVQAVTGQMLFSNGLATIQKNANGDLLTSSGDSVVLKNLLFKGDAAAPVYTGHNIVMTGEDPALWNCGSMWAAGRALKATGNHVSVFGSAPIYQTADQTVNGYDIEVGKNGTNTGYHEIHGVKTSQATGGFLFIDCGEQKVIGGQVGKLRIQNATAQAAANGGETIGVRILGNVTVEYSSATFTACHFGAVAIVFAAGTSACTLDESNVLAIGATISNLGNSNNRIRKNISTGGFDQERWGDDASVAIIQANLASGYYRVTGLQLPNNKYLFFEKASDGSQSGGIAQDSSDNILVNSVVSNAVMALQTVGASSRIQASIAGTLRAVIDAAGIRMGGASSPFLTSGAGSPEGVVTAIIGSRYARTDGGAATSMYVKESGTGNTGWVAK